MTKNMGSLVILCALGLHTMAIHADQKCVQSEAEIIAKVADVNGLRFDQIEYECKIRVDSIRFFMAHLICGLSEARVESEWIYTPPQPLPCEQAYPIGDEVSGVVVLRPSGELELEEAPR